MTIEPQNRRHFLAAATAAATGVLATPYWSTSPRAFGATKVGKNNRPLVGCIGTGDRWNGLYKAILPHGDIAAVCDVDSKHAEFGKEKSGGKAEIYGDYRKLLDRADIELVSISTPDHWHAKIAIDAMRAGKDVYCEKPLTLTIDEGKRVCQVAKETGRVFQVGTQQRTEANQRFLKAVALVREGRIGKVLKATCAIGGAPSGGPFAPMPVPRELDWNQWLGQAPTVDYTENRCHYQFRWWYEYSGGKMTDWGAHHVDIATWAIDAGHTGPTSVEGTAVLPKIPNGYNTATEFLVTCHYDGGPQIIIRHDTENGITFEGEKGTFFVSRGALRGKPVDELKEHPLPAGAIEKLYGDVPTSHMANFFKAVKNRSQPISDVYSHHRALATCHLANIAIRLGRKIAWDPVAEEIINDPEARLWQSRTQRAGFEVA